MLTAPSCSHLLPGLCTPNLSVQPAAAAQTCSWAPDVRRPRAIPHGQQVPSSQSFSQLAQRLRMDAERGAG